MKAAALVLVIAGALSGSGGAMSEVNALSVSKVNQEEDTMPVIAILGAGPGMGLAIAKTFGAHGYRVALLSRHSATQEPLVPSSPDTASSRPPFAPTRATAIRSRPASPR